MDVCLFLCGQDGGSITKELAVVVIGAIAAAALGAVAAFIQNSQARRWSHTDQFIKEFYSQEFLQTRIAISKLSGKLREANAAGWNLRDAEDEDHEDGFYTDDSNIWFVAKGYIMEAGGGPHYLGDSHYGFNEHDI